MTAIRLIIFFVISLSLNAKGQVSFYSFKETDQIVIESRDTSKMQVYIFLDSNGKSIEKSKLEFLLQTNIIDHENFEFHVLNITLIEGCSRKKKIELYNYSKLKFDFPVQPFYCLIDSRGEKYERLKFERIPSTGKNPFVKIVDMDGKPAPFEATRDLDAIRNLLFIAQEALSEISSLPQLNRDLEKHSALIDSLQRELEKTKARLSRQTSFVRLDLMPYPLSFPSIKDKGTSLRHNLRQASWAVQVCKFPFLFNEDLGWISSIGYSGLNGDYTSASKIDTLNRMAIDPDGESYIRIAKVENLGEAYSLINLHFQLAPIYRVNTRQGVFSIYSGIGLNLTTSSHFKSTSGTVTFHGIYPQYNSNEASFDGKYDFGRVNEITSATQELHIQKYSLSWISGLDYLHRLGKGSPLSAGIGFRYFSSRIKLSRQNEKGIQVRSVGEYSSGLYNYSNVQYRQLSLSFLFSYSIN